MSKTGVTCLTLTQVSFLFLLMIVSLGCSTKSYQICDGTTCRPVSKAEALEAAEVSKEWGSQSKLQLKINKAPL